MKNTFILAAAVLLAAAVPASAADTAPAKAASHVCLQRSHIDGWGARDKKSMIIDDIFGKKYLLNLAGACDDLQFSMAAGVKGFGGPGMCVERGDKIVMRGGGVGMHGPCWVTKVQYYTPEMAAADKAAREAKQKLPAY